MNYAIKFGIFIVVVTAVICAYSYWTDCQDKETYYFLTRRDKARMPALIADIGTVGGMLTYDAYDKPDYVLYNLYIATPHSWKIKAVDIGHTTPEGENEPCSWMSLSTMKGDSDATVKIVAYRSDIDDYQAALIRVEPEPAEGNYIEFRILIKNFPEEEASRTIEKIIRYY